MGQLPCAQGLAQSWGEAAGQMEIVSVTSDSMAPWAAGHQARLPMGFSSQEYWSGLPFPSPQGSNPGLLPCRWRTPGKKGWEAWAYREHRERGWVEGPQTPAWMPQHPSRPHLSLA